MPLRETTFIARNLDTWQRLEAELGAPRPNPDVLRDLYAAVSDDLSYARTHYPNRSVRSFLNTKAAILSLSLSKNQRRGIAVRKFFTERVPLELYAERKSLLVAFAIFLAAFLVGWFSSVADPGFARTILSSGYVEMTEENISKGDPMAVYKSGSMLGGALGITGNNLRVALLCFVTGVTWGAGTLFVMIYNGVMVGSFQQFFFARDVGFESVLSIWTHGTIEISCIIVAGAAGLVLARGLIWPGTLSRSRSFQLSALSGLRIMAGIAPLIVLAGFIEGFVTRLTFLPTVFRVGFLLLNLAFVIYYFVVRPRQVGRYAVREAEDYGTLPPDRPLVWRADVRQGVGEMFFDGYRFLGGEGTRYVGWVVLLAFGAAGLSLLMLYLLDRDIAAATDLLQHTGSAYFVDGLDGITSAVCGALVVVGFATVTYAIHRHLPGPPDEEPAATREARRVADPNREPTALREYIATVIGLCVPWTLLVVVAYLQLWLALLALPFAAVWMRGITYTHGRVARGLSEGLGYAFSMVGSFLGLSLMLAANYLAVSLLYQALVRSYALDFIALLFPSTLQAVSIAEVIGFSLDLSLTAVITLFCVLVFGLFYGTSREYRLATGLRDRLQRVLA